MVRNILVGLDNSPYSRAVADLAVGWAGRFGAGVVGVAVIDEPRISAAVPTGIGGGYYKFRVERGRMAEARALAAELAARFRARCAAAGVAAETRCEAGDPVDVLLGLHEDFDVTLLGRETWFRCVTQGEPDEVLTEVLRRASRPVVAVPESVPGGDAVVVAYDGGEAATDALRAFAASGLGVGRRTSVVTVAGDRAVAARTAAEAARYLVHHDVPATPQPVATDGDEAAALAAAAEMAGAGMVVMGAYSRGRLREWYDRSTTTRMLHRPGCLLYLHHHPD